MTIHALKYDLLTINEHTIFFVASVCVTILDSTETEPLTFHVQSFSIGVLQRKDSSIEIGLFSIPSLNILGAEVYLGLVTGNRKDGLVATFLPLVSMTSTLIELLGTA